MRNLVKTVFVDRGLMNVWDKPIYSKYYVMDDGNIYEATIEKMNGGFVEVYDPINKDSLLYRQIMGEV